MLIKDISPFIRHARHFTLSCATPSAFKDVRTRDNRIFCVTEGEGRIVIEGKKYELKPDTLILIRSGEHYRLEPSGKVSVTVINFDFTENFSTIKQSFHPFSSDFPGVLENVTFDDALFLSSHVVIPSAHHLYDQLSRICGEFYEGGEWRDAYLGAMLKAVIIDLVRTASDTATHRGRSRLVEDVIRYMREHYSERVENETLSEYFHFTSVYINRVFKREMGVSLRQYLIALRVDIAKELIASGECSPSEAAIATGFDDYPHFSKTFKALTGKTPKEYRSPKFY